MSNVKIGRNSRIRRAIIDTGVQIPESTVVGYDAEDDRARGYTITDSGIVVVPSLEQRMSNEIPAGVAAG
jgi:glucose-1-phosphate adenylyltransferase